jgi:hypothetical protein
MKNKELKYRIRNYNDDFIVEKYCFNKYYSSIYDETYIYFMGSFTLLFILIPLIIFGFTSNSIQSLIAISVLINCVTSMYSHENMIFSTYESAESYIKKIILEDVESKKIIDTTNVEISWDGEELKKTIIK